MPLGAGAFIKITKRLIGGGLHSWSPFFKRFKFPPGAAKRRGGRAGQGSPANFTTVHVHPPVPGHTWDFPPGHLAQPAFLIFDLPAAASGSTLTGKAWKPMWAHWPDYLPMGWTCICVYYYLGQYHSEWHVYMTLGCVSLHNMMVVFFF